MKLKDLIFSLSFLVLLVFAGNEAITAQVTSQRMAMSRGNNDAIILELPTADEKLVSNLWSDWLKDNYEVKTKRVKKTKNEMQSLNFSIPGVSTGGKVDLYSSVRTSGGGSELMIWIATTDGYMSPELGSSRYIEAEKMLMRFALAVSRDQIEMEITDQEKELRNLEKELDKLRKEKENFEKDIADAKRAIQEAKGNSEKNLDDQENKGSEREAKLSLLYTSNADEEHN